MRMANESAQFPLDRGPLRCGSDQVCSGRSTDGVGRGGWNLEEVPLSNLASSLASSKSCGLIYKTLCRIDVKRWRMPETQKVLTHRSILIFKIEVVNEGCSDEEDESSDEEDEEMDSSTESKQAKAFR